MKHFLLLFVFFLSACGGGSSGGDSGVLPGRSDPTDNPLVVSDIRGGTTAFIGQQRQYEILINDADGLQDVAFRLVHEGSGFAQDLSYSVTDDLYALNVDFSGALAGEYLVDARVTGINGLTGAASDELIRVLEVDVTDPMPLPDELAFNLWIGPDDTLADFSSSYSGVELYRSRDEECDVYDYMSCDMGQMDFLSGDRITDTSLTLVDDAFYRLKSGAEISDSAPVPEDRLVSGRGFATVEFEGRIWLFAGSKDGVLNNNVWSSDDGRSWTLESDDPGFSARQGHQVAVFAGKLWLIGGEDEAGRKSDIWSSSDGVSWTQELASAPFSGRYGHQLIKYDGQLWLIAGAERSGAANVLRSDVWRSSDGLSWELVTNAAGFEGRYFHQATVFDGRLWVLGSGAFPLSRDVWSSADGLTWSREEDLPVSRAYFLALVFDSQLWLISGSENGTGEIWVSSNGASWSAPTENISLNSATYVRGVVMDSEITVISENRDVWSSSDGSEWQILNDVFSPRSQHQVVVFQDRLWMFGGDDGERRNDIWSSDDGVSWSQEAHSALFSPRYGHRVIAFNDKLWLIGGDDNGGSPAPGSDPLRGDVWSSADGMTWVREVEEAGFSGRMGHELIVFDGKLWIIGGFVGPYSNDYASDVWSSTDGVNWVEATSAAEFGMRYLHQVYENDGKLWLIGGAAGSSTPTYTDVWSSPDGVSWIEETANAGFLQRSGHQVLFYEGSYWLVGGLDSLSDKLNDVWSSINGVEWVQVQTSNPFSGRYSHQLVDFGGEILLIGGLTDAGDREVSSNEVWSPSEDVIWRQAARGVITSN